MKFRKLFSRLSELIAPECCAACFEPIETGHTGAFCLRCQLEWEREKATCRSHSCGRPAKLTQYVRDSENRPHLPTLYAVAYHPSDRYSTPNRLLYKLKHNITNRLVEFVCAEYETILREGVPLLFDGSIATERIVIAWIPRRPESILLEGYDHMERCAKVLSARLGFEAIPILKRRRGAFEQKTLDAKGRLNNARDSLSAAELADISSATVILIDDLVTTGASMEAATELLYGAGARLVIPVALASSGDELA